jgi:hypothetical protein
MSLFGLKCAGGCGKRIGGIFGTMDYRKNGVALCWDCAQDRQSRKKDIRAGFIIT